MLTRLTSCDPVPTDEGVASILKHLNDRLKQGWKSRRQRRRETDDQVLAWSFSELIDGTYYVGEAVTDS